MVFAYSGPLTLSSFCLSCIFYRLIRLYTSPVTFSLTVCSNLLRVAGWQKCNYLLRTAEEKKKVMRCVNFLRKSTESPQRRLDPAKPSEQTLECGEEVLRHTKKKRNARKVCKRPRAVLALERGVCSETCLPLVGCNACVIFCWLAVA